MPQGVVAVIGSLNADVIVSAKRLPQQGETVVGHRYEIAPGGKGANQALAAARAGVATRIVGAVGRDEYARVALANLEAASVDLSGVQQTEDLTGIAQISVDDAGENTIVVVAGANGCVNLEQAISAVRELGGADIVLLQMEVPAGLNLSVLQTARSVGAISVFNTAPYTDNVPELAPLADIIICNEKEFALLSDAAMLSGKPETRARALACMNRQTVIVTLGRGGAFVATADSFAAVSSPAVEAIDTVGAGDTFCGYLAAGLASGRSVGESARIACAAAAVACTRRGAQAGIPEMNVIASTLKSLEAQR
ncbi:ribokinase [Martelella mediterranea]|uniref:Ribokinase n=1 Tax=Martelella mediterranea TaxID=293089 RepID=A0A4R3NEV9_9HYPH|nr:ribokinase [Martelella mediterranea]TCT28536.1 ribokinase [Martelella mediterranea]